MKILFENYIVKNILYWLAAFVLLFLIILSQANFDMALRITVMLIVPAPLPIYLHFLIFDRFFKKRKYIVYGLFLIAIVLLTGYVIEQFFYYLFNDPNSHISGIFVSIVLIVVTTATRYFRSNIINQYKLQEAEYKQLEIEMSLLKSQINPHFFFNTLNNLYGLSLNMSKEVPEVILKLSGLMRYVIDSQKKKKVSVEDELLFIENYIDLESLRFKDPSTIEYHKKLNSTNLQIAPMLLIPFIENAFKHGLSAMLDKGYLFIEVECNNKAISLKVKNSIQQGRPDDIESSGLGLENVKRRLEILYPGQYKLNIQNLLDRFEVELTINLS